MFSAEWYLADLLLPFLPPTLVEIVVDYAHFPSISPRRGGCLEWPGNEPIQGTSKAFAMRRHDGSVITWGDQGAGGDSSSVQSELKNVKAICAAEYGAFAAIVGGGTVVCWGNKECGGDSSTVSTELKHVEAICASGGAFAALRKDGTVVTWGSKEYGGDSSSVQLQGVRAISSTDHAFAAVLSDGTVETWGAEISGLIPPEVKARLKNVQLIRGSSRAFAALLADGTVQIWGDKWPVGASANILRNRNAVSLCGADTDFAVVTETGPVHILRPRGHGGFMEAIVPVIAISSTGTAFAALLKDGGVRTWGSDGFGGDASSVAKELRDVVAIQGNNLAFAALRKDGTVITWGAEDCGGDSSSVKSELQNIVAISSTAYAFAARRKDGTVVTWGQPDRGGDSSSVPILKPQET